MKRRRLIIFFFKWVRHGSSTAFETGLMKATTKEKSNAIQWTLWPQLDQRHGRRTKKTLQRIKTFIIRCLRRIFNIWWPERICNEELWQRGRQEPVIRQILRRKWGWIGHTLRKKTGNITRKLPKIAPDGKMLSMATLHLERWAWVSSNYELGGWLLLK